MASVNTDFARRAAETLAQGIDQTSSLPQQQANFASRFETAMTECGLSVPPGASGNTGALLTAAKASLIENARLADANPQQSDAILRNMAAFLQRINEMGQFNPSSDPSGASPNGSSLDFSQPRSETVTEKVHRGPNVSVQVTLGRSGSGLEKEVDAAAAGPNAQILDLNIPGTGSTRYGRFALVLECDRSCEKLMGLFGDQLGAQEYHPGSPRHHAGTFEGFVAVRVRDQLRHELFMTPNADSIPELTGIVRVNVSNMPWLANLKTRDLPDRIVSQIRDSAGMGVYRMVDGESASRAA